MTKCCTKCGKEKHAANFGRIARNSDVLQSQCRDCRNADNVQWRRENQDKCRAYARKFRMENTDKLKRKKRAWRASHPEVHKAHCVLTNAVARGHIEKRPCESCGAERVHGHHDSYEPEHWLDVRWLCSRCHRAYHDALGAPATNDLQPSPQSTP